MANLLFQPRDYPFDDRAFVTAHSPFQDRRRVSAPINRHRPPARHQGDDQQVMVAFNRPINGQTQFAGSRQLREGVLEDRLGQEFGRKPLVMKQAREALYGSLLIAKLARQLRLIGGLMFNDRSDEINNRFELMTVRPRQQPGG